MKFSFSLLWANALLFLLFGTSFLVLPEQMALLVTESAPASPAGLTDMRATYGGLCRWASGCFWVTAHTQAHTGLVCWHPLLVLSCAALGRLLGIFLEGEPTSMMVLLLTAEIVFSVLSVVALVVSDNKNICGA